MSSLANGDHLERLAEEAVEHLRLIHKYAAWKAFFIVLAGLLCLIGLILSVFDAALVVG